MKCSILSMKSRWTRLTIGLFLTSITIQSMGEERLAYPTYELANPHIAVFFDSLIKKDGTNIFGEIHCFVGRVPILTILTQNDKAGNRPSQSELQDLNGVLLYDSILWYVFDPIPVNNIIKETGDSVDVRFVADGSNTVENSQSYYMREDMLDGVELLFDISTSESDSSVCNASNIRKLIPQELERYK